MPLALDPKQKFPVVLKSDQDKPEDEQPTFYFRYASNREWREMAGIADDVGSEKVTIDEAYSHFEGKIKRVLVGWKNMVDIDGNEIKFNPDDLDKLLCPKEMFELLVAARDGAALSGEDKKKSELPSPSSTENSAETVHQEGTVTTDPAS